MGCERSIVNGLSDLAYLFDFTTIDKRENCLIVFYTHLLDLNLINPKTKLNLMFTQFFKSDINSSTLLILKHLHKIENHHQTIDQQAESQLYNTVASYTKLCGSAGSLKSQIPSQLRSLKVAAHMFVIVVGLYNDAIKEKR
jgi:hypothetical protein